MFRNDRALARVRGALTPPDPLRRSTRPRPDFPSGRVNFWLIASAASSTCQIGGGSGRYDKPTPVCRTRLARWVTYGILAAPLVAILSRNLGVGATFTRFRVKFLIRRSQLQVLFLHERHELIEVL